MCECVEKVNETLEKKVPGLRVDGTINLHTVTVRPRIPLYMLGGGKFPKGCPKYVSPSFCPFCGEKYPEDQA